MEESVESEFVRCLVAQAALVIAGLKPAAVFGFIPRAWKKGDARSMRSLTAQLLAYYANKTRDYGVRLAWLGVRDASGCMMLAWRPAQVAALLADESSRAFLAEAGLPVTNERELMAAYVGRLRAYYAGRAEFPHEVGLVLGYPVEDVRGFMADGGRGAKAVGRWRCYGNVDAARRRFEELGREERRYKRLYSQGVPMRELLRMGAAA